MIQAPMTLCLLPSQSTLGEQLSKQNGIESQFILPMGGHFIIGAQKAQLLTLRLIPRFLLILNPHSSQIQPIGNFSAAVD